MEFGAAFWVERTDWPSLRQAALAAEAAGFDALWIDDHLLNDEGDVDAPKLEAWTVLAALAAVTSRPTLGPLVGANTLRNPGLLAKIAVTVDEISAGRLVLGLGAGWFEREHDAFGFEFGASAGERIDRLAEALPLVRRLLDGERVTHDGRWYHLRDAFCSPAPRHRVPILVGGSGPRKTLPLVARSADAWNTYATPAELAHRSAILDAACRDAGRDPGSIHRSVNVNVVVRPSAREAQAAFDAVLDTHDPQPGEEALDVGGPPEDVARLVAAYAQLGVDQVIWVFRSPWDEETIAALPAVRAALAEAVAGDPASSTSASAPDTRRPRPHPAPTGSSPTR
jgi:F420-dependent oxidoreductase-like protein